MYSDWEILQVYRRRGAEVDESDLRSNGLFADWKDGNGSWEPMIRDVHNAEEGTENFEQRRNEC